MRQSMWRQRRPRNNNDQKTISGVWSLVVLEFHEEHLDWVSRNCVVFTAMTNEQELFRHFYT